MRSSLRCFTRRCCNRFAIECLGNMARVDEADRVGQKQGDSHNVESTANQSTDLKKMCHPRRHTKAHKEMPIFPVFSFVPLRVPWWMIFLFLENYS